MIFTIWFILAYITGTLIEYLFHRGMHEGLFLKTRHWNHHKTQNVDGVLLEFLTYVWIVIPFMLIAYPFLSWAAWLGWFFGGVFFIAFMSYAHELQHEYPGQVFWMRYPVHYLHHYYFKGEYNFGITTSFWDWFFKSRKLEGYRPFKEKLDLRKILGIRWI